MCVVVIFLFSVLLVLEGDAQDLSFLPARPRHEYVTIVFLLLSCFGVFRYMYRAIAHKLVEEAVGYVNLTFFSDQFSAAMFCLSGYVDVAVCLVRLAYSLQYFR